MFWLIEFASVLAVVVITINVIRDEYLVNNTTAVVVSGILLLLELATLLHLIF